MSREINRGDFLMEEKKNGGGGTLELISLSFICQF